MDVKEDGIRGRGYSDSIFSYDCYTAKMTAKCLRLSNRGMCWWWGGERVRVTFVIMSRARRKQRSLLEEAAGGGGSGRNFQINIASYRQKRGPVRASARGSALHHFLLIVSTETPVLSLF